MNIIFFLSVSAFLVAALLWPFANSGNSSLVGFTDAAGHSILAFILMAVLMIPYGWAGILYAAVAVFLHAAYESSMAFINTKTKQPKFIFILSGILIHTVVFLKLYVLFGLEGLPGIYLDIAGRDLGSYSIIPLITAVLLIMYIGTALPKSVVNMFLFRTASLVILPSERIIDTTYMLLCLVSVIIFHQALWYLSIILVLFFSTLYVFLFSFLKLIPERLQVRYVLFKLPTMIFCSVCVALIFILC